MITYYTRSEVGLQVSKDLGSMPTVETLFFKLLFFAFTSIPYMTGFCEVFAGRETEGRAEGWCQ